MIKIRYNFDQFCISLRERLMLAFVSGLKSTHMIKSNKESGLGRYDIALIPKNINKLGIIMEFKAINDPNNLDQAAIEALEQINKSKYISELKVIGIKNICSIGISFSRKAIKVVKS